MNVKISKKGGSRAFFEKMNRKNTKSRQAPKKLPPPFLAHRSVECSGSCAPNGFGPEFPVYIVYANDFIQHRNPLAEQVL
jgi:hypothetical protein